MKARLTVIVISTITAILCLSGGYGFTEKRLVIKGNIEVLSPEALVAGPQSEIEIGVQSETEIGAQPETEIGVQSETEIGVQSETEIGVQSETGIEVQDAVDTQEVYE